jgi:diguanylate cyclase (GGDEF)-like protein
MSYRMSVYAACILILCALLAVAGVALVPLPAQTILVCLVLALASGLAQAYEAAEVGQEPRYTAVVFLFAGLLLLTPVLFAGLLLPTPVLFAGMALLSYGLGWVLQRLEPQARPPARYARALTIASQLSASLAVMGLLHLWGITGQDVVTPYSMAAALAGALAFALVNNLVRGLAAVLTPPHAWAKLSAMIYPAMLIDLILLSLGYVIAVLWQVKPLLLLPALLPLILICQGLKIPQLELEAKTDSKTGLWNVRYFYKAFAVELQRAKELGKPLAVLMADLDLLRNINNIYGHLAGDAVLAGVGKLIRETIGDKDIAARFGGEEFAVVMPGATLAEALDLAEELRRRIEDAAFEARTSPLPINATISIGVAGFPDDGMALVDLIHQADVAVYQAKLSGRNRVVCATAVGASTEFGHAPLSERRFAVLPDPTAERLAER